MYEGNQTCDYNLPYLSAITIMDIVRYVMDPIAFTDMLYLFNVFFFFVYDW